MARDRGLAAAGRADDEADVPGFLGERQMDGPLLAARLVGRDVEEAADLFDARRVVDLRLYDDSHRLY